MYSEYMRQSSVYEKVILRDIPRTYPELEFFKDGGRGQSSLFNVIKAYSIHDKEMPEEEAFAVLLRLMENYRLRELYKPTMTDLGLCMFQLECIVQEQMPDLHAHFNNVGFHTSMFASPWFLTLFTTTMPLEIANRIMDCFLAEYFQRDIRERFENDPDLLFHVAYKVQLNPKRMKKLEKEYLAKRTKEQEEAVELRRLRTENRLLRQRIDYLEAESSALADRLVKGQVNLAKEAENCINIAHELSKLRDINSDAHKKLEDAYETIRELSSTKRDEFVEMGIQVDDTTMIERIHSLTQELIDAHTRQADSENSIRETKNRILELESANKRLREDEPSEGIAGLQEELISVKMRGAESSLALKEMRQRMAELEQQWAKYVHDRAFDQSPTSEAAEPPKEKEQPSPPIGQLNSARAKLAKITASLMGSPSEEETNGITVRELEDQLMGVRIKEIDTLAELKEMRQKTRKELENELKEQKIKFVQREGELKEECINERLKYSESMQNIQDLKQSIAQLELKKAEKWTRNQLRGSSVCDLDDETNSHGSASSNGDALSLASDDMNALVADMAIKVPTLEELVEEKTDGNDTTDSGVQLSDAR
ncbi:hypothetical protein WR25_00730 isoform C [Diploscapter pachys]|nr:hypothetical protein WR25_00730 isoform C [Diploscapter pachys]